MRTLFLATALTFTIVPAVQAMTMPTLTFPEPGTFCGFMTLCGADANKAEAAEDS